MVKRAEVEMVASARREKAGVSYMRVSTADQFLDASGNRKADGSIESQRDRCEEHARYLGTKTGVKHRILHHLSDEGLSGKNTKRPQYQRLWQLIGKRAIDFVIATELSRLSRNVHDFLEMTAHCKTHDVEIHVIGLDLDTSTHWGNLVVIILVALAQFEREMTAHRVRENGLTRLLNDGKISGGGEILGLSRDAARPGHFLPNPTELETVAKILRIYLKEASLVATLKVAITEGLVGKNGKPLTRRTLEIIMNNCETRYRGVWYANRANKGKDQELLPASHRYQPVKLPYGPLLEEDLVNQVIVKKRETFAKRRVSNNDQIYLLSHILFHEDGTPFKGSSAKRHRYLYYFNRTNRVRIDCKEIEGAIVGRLKSYLQDSTLFAKLVADALRKRELGLSQIDAEIRKRRRELADLHGDNSELLTQLVSKSQETETTGQISATTLTWLDEQIRAKEGLRHQKEREVQALQVERDEVIRRSGLASLQESVQEFIDGFDKLTGTQKRNLIERIVSRIVIRKDNKVELHLHQDPKAATGVVSATGKKLQGDEIGVGDGN